MYNKFGDQLHVGCGPYSLNYKKTRTSTCSAMPGVYMPEAAQASMIGTGHVGACVPGLDIACECRSDCFSTFYVSVLVAPEGRLGSASISAARFRSICRLVSASSSAALPALQWPPHSASSAVLPTGNRRTASALPVASAALPACRSRPHSCSTCRAACQSTAAAPPPSLGCLTVAPSAASQRPQSACDAPAPSANLTFASSAALAALPER